MRRHAAILSLLVTACLLSSVLADEEAAKILSKNTEQKENLDFGAF